jgi:hypothetical protein
MKPVYVLNQPDQRLYQITDAGLEEIGTTIRSAAPLPVIDSIWFQLRGALWCAMMTADSVDVARLDGVNLRIVRSAPAPAVSAVWGDAIVFGGEALWLERREDGSATMHAFDGETFTQTALRTLSGTKPFLPSELSAADRMPLIIASGGLAIGFRAVDSKSWNAPIRVSRDGLVSACVIPQSLLNSAPDMIIGRLAASALNEFRLGQQTFSVMANGRLLVRDAAGNITSQKRLVGAAPTTVQSIVDGEAGAELIVAPLTNDTFESYIGWEFTPASGAQAGEAFTVVSDQNGRLSLRNKLNEPILVQSRNLSFTVTPPLVGACEMFELAGGIAGVVVGPRVGIAFFSDGRQVRTRLLAARGDDVSIFADAESSRIFVSTGSKLVAVDALSLLDTPIADVPGIVTGAAYAPTDLSVTMGTPLVDPVSRRVALQGEVFGDGPVLLTLEFNVGQGWRKSKAPAVTATATPEGAAFTLVHTVDVDVAGYVGDFTYRVQATRQGT